MPDYSEMYCLLFNAITDALAALDNGCHDLAKEALIKAQQNAEEAYISLGG